MSIEIDRVTKRFRQRGRADRTAVDDVSLTVEAGSHLALLGPNGSGKSTLLRMMAGLLTPDEGSVRVLGGPARASAGRIGVVFQRVSLDPLLTVRENLMTHAAMYGASAARVEMVSDELGIADRTRDRVGTLSGGLARRVDLARALLHEPAVLLLDEPTAGLDPTARQAFLDVLASLSMTIVMSTHLMDEAERADDVALMNEGRLAAHDAPSALRAACGGRIIRCASTDAGALAGLDVRRVDGEVVAAVDDGAEGVAARLASAGTAFSIGPPTLGDAYAALTGRSLEDGRREDAS